MASKGRTILLSLVYFLLIRHTHSETDILVQGQKLRGGEHLASSGGTFRLTISHSGGSLVVSNSVQAANNASAMLLESGNFILREQNSDGSTSQVLWQSFDHPTDTLLPGMKLGISMKTTDIWSLTWWISESNPAKGTFTLTAGFNMDDESMLVIWWKGNTYWISGNWQNGHFEFVPRLSNERDISFSYISNENEKSEFQRKQQFLQPGCLFSCARKSYVVDIGCPICNWDCSSTSFMLLIQFHSKKMQTERREESRARNLTM
nr:g-type lectin s-receptor-like serine/threonine-protein kinase [Quercus suber]